MDRNEALELIREHGGTTKAARAIGVSRTTLQSWASGHRKPAMDIRGRTAETWTASPDSATLVMDIDTPCRTVEDVVAKVDVDMDVWEVERFTCQSNKWDMGYVGKDGKARRKPMRQWKLTVSFKRRKFDFGQAAEAALEVMRGEAPRPPKRRPRIKRTERTAEFCVFDFHLGKLCWEDETGQDQNLHSAYDMGIQVVEDMVDRCGDVDRIVFPIGNDFLHVDNLFNSTTMGTRQDVDGRPHKVFAMGHRLLCDQIKLMAEVAPVEVVTVPGNHDMMSAFHLGLCAEAYFDRDDFVTFDNSPRFRKYIKLGRTLLGFSHQSKEDPKMADLPLVMAQENRANGWWGSTEWAEFHTAHTHKKRRVEHLACEDKGGVVVYTIPSICATDAWHAQKGFINWNRCAELRTFDHENGPEAIINIYPRA